MNLNVIWGQGSVMRQLTPLGSIIDQKGAGLAERMALGQARVVLLQNQAEVIPPRAQKALLVALILT